MVEKYQEQYLTNNMLRGKVDEVLILDDDMAAPLDYKFAQYKDKVFNTYKTQLACYAWLIEDNFERIVNRGNLVYTRSKSRLVEVELDENDEFVKQFKAAVGMPLTDYVNHHRIESFKTNFK